MKLSSKISLGYAVVIALMVGMLIYQSSIIHQMQEVNRRLSQVNFRAANLSDQLRQTLDPIEEFTRKFVVTRDPGYRRQVKERQDLFEQHLEQIDSLTLSDQYRSGIELILILWQQYRTADSELETSPPGGGGSCGPEYRHPGLIGDRPIRVNQVESAHPGNPGHRPGGLRL